MAPHVDSYILHPDGICLPASTYTLSPCKGVVYRNSYIFCAHSHCPLVRTAVCDHCRSRVDYHIHSSALVLVPLLLDFQSVRKSLRDLALMPAHHILAEAELVACSRALPEG